MARMNADEGSNQGGDSGMRYPMSHLPGGGRSGLQLVPPNSVTLIPWTISLALATCSHHPVMWAAGIINPSHELILPPNTSGRIEAPPPPPLQERKKRLQPN